MTCASARHLMLEADLAQLTPQADTELGAHLGSCAACRRAAEEIREQQGGLAAWLAAAAPAGDDASAIARAGATARRRTRARRIGTAVTLAAAAGLAGLLVLPAKRDATGPLPAGRPALAARGFSVVASPGHEVMVLQPADSNIVVVWYLPNRRSS
jgi:anti-sigma factor RsiW